MAAQNRLANYDHMGVYNADVYSSFFFLQFTPPIFNKIGGSLIH